MNLLLIDDEAVISKENIELLKVADCAVIISLDGCGGFTAELLKDSTGKDAVVVVNA